MLYILQYLYDKFMITSLEIKHTCTFVAGWWLKADFSRLYLTHANTLLAIQNSVKFTIFHDQLLKYKLSLQKTFLNAQYLKISGYFIKNHQNS